MAVLADLEGVIVKEEARLMKCLAGKTALVTGGTRNLGFAMASRLAASGALVAVNYAANDTAASQAVQTITGQGGRAFAVKARLGEPAAVRTFVDKLATRLTQEAGRATLDILINNVGGGSYGTIASTTPEAYEEMFSNNVHTPFFLTQALLPILNEGGRVINISSAASRLAGQDFAVYSMSKAALDMFTRILAKDLGPRRINVNAVQPGFNATESNAEVLDDAEMHGKVTEMTAFGRFGEPDDIADVVHFLASPDSRWVTGQIIEASGGFAM